MGYFSNGTEGASYEESVCRHCKHEPTDHHGCAVLMAHSLWNYAAAGKDADSEKAAVLEAMIPCVGIRNGVCTLFAARDPAHAGAVVAYGCRVEEARAKYERDKARNTQPATRRPARGRRTGTGR